MQDDFLNPFITTLIAALIGYVIHYAGGGIIRSAMGRITARHKHENESVREKHTRTLTRIFTGVLDVLVWLTVASIAMAAFGVDIAKVAAGAGLLGIVIGLGAQSTIKDILAGIFILGENQYRIGDIVTLNGGSVGVETSGVVEDITLRITKLRDLDGTLHTVRNGEASIITNRTYKYSRVVLDIGVAYDSDIDDVEKVMNRVGKEMLKEPELAVLIKEPIAFLRVDAFGDSAIMIKAIGSVEPAEQWHVAGEYRRRILKAFKEAHIEIAFPQVVVHNARTSKKPA